VDFSSWMGYGPRPKGAPRISLPPGASPTPRRCRPARMSHEPLPGHGERAPLGRGALSVTIVSFQFTPLNNKRSIYVKAPAGTYPGRLAGISEFVQVFHPLFLSVLGYQQRLGISLRLRSRIEGFVILDTLKWI
jgi:hypothetical protein